MGLRGSRRGWRVHRAVGHPRGLRESIGGKGGRARHILSPSLTEMKRSGVAVMEKLPCKDWKEGRKGGGKEGEMEESEEEETRPKRVEDKLDEEREREREWWT